MSEHPAVYQDMVRQASEWKTMHWYHIGDRVLWNGHLLRCGIDHYAGDAAVDPWDPGWGWDARKRSRLWQVVTSSEARS